MSDLLERRIPELLDPCRTDERVASQAEARRFAMEEVLPLANELDPQKAEIPRWFLDRIGEQGYFGVTIPREFGGLGLGVFEYCMISEELARAWMSVASIIARAQGMGTNIGDQERRLRLLEASARGQWIGAAALSEPSAGSDLANVQTRAVRDGDEWVINGQKVWTTLAHRADWCFVVTRTDPEAPAHKGISYILVPMHQPGITVRPLKQMTATAEF